MDGSGPAVPPRTKVTAEAVRTRKLELNLPDATSQQSAAAWFRGVLRLPDELKQNCVDDIVDLMRRFVELLSSEHQAVVTEAASVVERTSRPARARIARAASSTAGRCRCSSSWRQVAERACRRERGDMVPNHVQPLFYAHAI